MAYEVLKVEEFTIVSPKKCNRQISHSHGLSLFSPSPRISNSNSRCCVPMQFLSIFRKTNQEKANSDQAKNTAPRFSGNTSYECLGYEGPNGESIALFYQCIGEEKIKGIITMSSSIALHQFPRLNKFVGSSYKLKFLLVWSFAMAMSYWILTIIGNCFIAPLFS